MVNRQEPETTPQPQGWELESFESFFAGLPAKDEERAMKLYEQYVLNTITTLLAQKDAEKKALVREIVEVIKSVEVKYVWDNGECSMCGFESLSSGSHGCEDRNNLAERLLTTITAIAGKHGITTNEQEA